jgi:hypothetical protein
MRVRTRRKTASGIESMKREESHAPAGFRAAV